MQINHHHHLNDIKFTDSIKKKLNSTQEVEKQEYSYLFYNV